MIESSMKNKAAWEYSAYDFWVREAGRPEELAQKKIQLTAGARSELLTLSTALEEILEITLSALENDDPEAAASVEPLEQVIDHLKAMLRDRHIARMKEGQCSVEAGFIWSDLLTALERTSDHCSNIAVSIIDARHHDMNAHRALRRIKEGDPRFFEMLDHYSQKYALTQI